MDDGPNMVAGEVGAQAERDLTTLFGKRTRGKRDDAGSTERGEDRQAQSPRLGQPPIR